MALPQPESKRPKAKPKHPTDFEPFTVLSLEEVDRRLKTAYTIETQDALLDIRCDLMRDYGKKAA